MIKRAKKNFSSLDLKARTLSRARVKSQKDVQGQSFEAASLMHMLFALPVAFYLLHLFLRKMPRNLNLHEEQSIQMIKTVEWTDEGVRMLDQRLLPTEEKYLMLRSYEEVAEAIKKMVVRGAPAIGVSAAMGLALGAKQSVGTSVADLEFDFDYMCEVMSADATDRRQSLLGHRADARRFDAPKRRPMMSKRSRSDSSQRRKRSSQKTSNPTARWAALAAS